MGEMKGAFLLGAGLRSADVGSITTGGDGGGVHFQHFFF